MAWLLQPCDTLGKPTLIFPPTTSAILRRSRSFLEIGGRKFYQGLSVVFMWPFTVLDHLMSAANAARSLLLLKFVFQPFIAATCSAPELGFVAMNLTVVWLCSGRSPYRLVLQQSPNTPDKSFMPNRDLEWYFFSPRDKKYPNGTRTNRATEAGDWKATGKDRKISSKSSMIGTKKTLAFYGGRAPQGRRTDWVMHEYRLDETQCEGAAGVQDAFVLCCVFKKNGIEPRIGSSNEPPIQRNAFPSVMNSSFSDKMTKPDAVEDLSDKSYHQVKQEKADIQADTTLRSETSFERLHDRTDNSATLNQWLEFLLHDSSPSCFLASPANAKNDLKVSSMIGDARLEQESLWPMFKIDNFSQGVADLSFNQFTSQIEPMLSHTTDACFEEEDVLDKILKVAQAAQNEDTHNEHTFLMAKLSVYCGLTTASPEVTCTISICMKKRTSKSLLLFSPKFTR